MTRPPRLTGATSAGLALLVSVLLTGCTGDDDSDPGAGPSQGAPGEPLASVDAEGYPLDYPKDEIPLVPGDITSTEIGGKKNPGYSFAILADEPPAETLTEAVDLLTDAGWTTESRVDPAAPQPQVLNRGKDLVIVTAVESEGQTVVSYAIQLG